MYEPVGRTILIQTPHDVSLHLHKVESLDEETDLSFVHLLAKGRIKVKHSYCSI